MSTAEERIAKKEAEIKELQTESALLTREIYHRLEMRITTDEQRELLKRYKAANREIDRFDERYWKRSEELREERDKIFNELIEKL